MFSLTKTFLQSYLLSGLKMDAEKHPKSDGDFDTKGQNICLSYVGEKTETEVQVESPSKYLIYGIKDSPPIHITVICGLQVNYSLTINKQII